MPILPYHISGQTQGKEKDTLELNFILTLLGIKNPNVNLISSFITEEKFKLNRGLIIHKAVHAKLDKIIHPKCLSCGGKTIKNGGYITTKKIPTTCEHQL